MAFEAFLKQDQARPNTRRRLLVTASLAVHGALLVAGVVYSFWHVDTLSPPTVTVTFLANAPPPPPPPAAKKKRSDTKRVPRDITQPKPNEIVQPKKEEKEEPDDGVEGGVEGGVAGGIVGGVGTGPAPPPARPKLVPPNIGLKQLAVNVYVRPYRLELPPSFRSTDGVSLWAMLQICVNAGGSVSSVSIVKSMDKSIDGLLQAKVRTWRYKPMTVDGRPIPFCHRLRYNYKT